MPIVSLLQEAAFDPETTHILTTAFNKAWDKFKSSGSALADDACAPSTRALLAKQIIETARTGERNIDRLVENLHVQLRPAPGTALQSPETGSQNRRYRDLSPAAETARPAFEPAEMPANCGLFVRDRET